MNHFEIQITQKSLTLCIYLLFSFGKSHFYEIITFENIIEILQGMAQLNNLNKNHFIIVTMMVNQLGIIFDSR